MAFGIKKDNQKNDLWNGNAAWNEDVRRNAGLPPVTGANAFTIDGDVRDTVSTYIGKTFLWMFLGLAVTFVLAYMMAATGITYRLLAGMGSVALVIVTIAEFACVIIMSTRIGKMQPSTAAILFFLYAALTGVVFSFYFLLFELSTLIFAFAGAAIFFGLMAAMALIFKMELSGLRPYLFGGLIALIVLGILSMFLRIPALDTLLCYAGVAIFMGLTAYDVSRIRNNYYYYAQDAAMLKKASIYSALGLYLDFINIFLYIIRIFGNRRN